MRAANYIKHRQRLWALRRGLDLVASDGSFGEAYTASLDDNLFEPMGTATREEFREGDGDELGAGGKPGKMQALHSSSAIGCNIFHYWRSLGDAASIAGACDLTTAGLATSIEFEAKRPIAADAELC